MIICIVGPTGVGKSKLALEIAQSINGHIVNGDAFQIYQEMDIGTNKPTIEERSLVPHHLFSYVEPSYEFSVFDYQKSLRDKIKELEDLNAPIIVCGGTGMYLKASFYDFELKKANKEIDMSQFDNYSNLELHSYLKGIDELEANKIHQNNRRRVLRAIQIYLESGQAKSLNNAKQKHVPIYDVKFIGLTKDREELNKIINERVDKMFELGLFEEVKALMNKYPSNLRSFQAIGYKEIIEGINNQVSLEDIKELIKKNSRRYAKRQMTYFNHQLDVEWFKDIEDAKKYALELLKK